ncbi:hypothetical protein FRC12_007218 [Ceratobasidium sp. 428]|nr:hypothetical protein FRC12_007218 [Ceratobasidium sp. 428]
MLKQRRPGSAARHIPNPYDGRELGRDDPVWQNYVEEAEKWDSDLVDGWNKGMDNLLLFAGLFSAVVTAFTIESYKRLQPDSAELTATGIAQITTLLEAIALQEVPNTQNSTSVAADFQITASALIINLTWFLSLSLSILVALLAMLVKQWGEVYRSGHQLTPPCVQARIRQSRFDKMTKWHTEDLVLVLPVIMHVALALFLLGLLVFLWDLNHIVALPVMVVVAAILACYCLTTILPLFVAFCPYDTPLSSRRLWGYTNQLFWTVVNLLSPFAIGSRSNKTVPPCQRKEKEIYEESIPDKVTGRALNWLVGHSKDESAVDVAIRAIAGADLSKEVWEIIAENSLIVLVAQKFTALFGGALDQEGGPQEPTTETEGNGDKKKAEEEVVADEVEQSRKLKEMQDVAAEDENIKSLYGRALTNIAKYKPPVEAGADLGARVDLELPAGEAPSLPLTLDQIQAVTRGLH